MAKLLQNGYRDRPLGKAKETEPGLNNLAHAEVLPCVVYETDETFRIVNVTPNIRELLGIEAGNLLGTTWFCNDRVAFPDRELVQARLGKLKTEVSACLMHRLIDDNGMVVRVGHSVRLQVGGAQNRFHGCLIPIGDAEKGLATIEIDVVSKFIHKIGNHFQLLNLMFDSVRRNGASTKNLDALQHTTETAIGITRGFANLLQYSLVPTTIDLAELVEATIEAKSFFCSEKRVLIDFRRGGTNDKFWISGDAMFLDLAIAAVIDNAIEASPEGGVVRVELSPPSEALTKFGRHVTALRVIDSGTGISADELSHVSEPFYTTKAGHDGMGLSVASRFVEMHGGYIRLSSVTGAGTEVVIVLPTAGSRARLTGDAALQ